jgi:hypothetical protein
MPAASSTSGVATCPCRHGSCIPVNASYSYANCICLTTSHSTGDWQVLRVHKGVHKYCFTHISDTTSTMVTQFRVACGSAGEEWVMEDQMELLPNKKPDASKLAEHVSSAVIRGPLLVAALLRMGHTHALQVSTTVVCLPKYAMGPRQLDLQHSVLSTQNSCWSIRSTAFWSTCAVLHDVVCSRNVLWLVFDSNPVQE